MIQTHAALCLLIGAIGIKSACYRVFQRYIHFKSSQSSERDDEIKLKKKGKKRCKRYKETEND